MSEKPVCPKCGSDLTVEIVNMRRCNACGHQFGLVVNVISEAVRRRKEQGVHGWRRQVPPK